MIQMKGAPECILKLCDLNDEVRQAELILDSNIYDINLIEPVIEQKYQLYRNINECLSALNVCQQSSLQSVMINILVVVDVQQNQHKNIIQLPVRHKDIIHLINIINII
eukprot:321066_1